MLSVYKYTQEIADLIEFELPAHSKLLHVDTQSDGKNNTISLWAAVDTITPYKQKRFIRIAGTGHPIHEDTTRLKYINTFTMMDRKLWFHAFEVL